MASKQMTFVPSLLGFRGYSILESWVLSLQWKIRHKGLLNASISLSGQSAANFASLTFAFFYLFERLVFTLISPYVKVNIGYRMRMSEGTTHVITATLGAAIPLFDEGGQRLPKNLIYCGIERQVRKYGERYQSAFITEVFINVYYVSEPFPTNFAFPTNILHEERDYFERVKEAVATIDQETMERELPIAKKKISQSSRIHNRMTALKKARKEERRSFFVGDLETVIVDEKHHPYAAGFLCVRPGEEITSRSVESIQTFFIEKRSHLLLKQMEERSHHVLDLFLRNLEDVVKTEKARTVFFHNLAKFDGLFLIKYYAKRGNQFKVKLLVRNHKIYEIKILLNRKILLRFRDSLALLPGSLAELSETMCPQLGPKGSIPHDTLEVAQLQDLKEELLIYLRTDVLLLAGVMSKAQNIYFEKFEIDIEDVLTISALAMKIFRSKYFNEREFDIHLPTKNVDQFVRRSYFGGRVEVYRPFGENLYYYDKNSLYAHIMKTKPFPCGEPKWLSNLEKVDINNLYGFFECYVSCPARLNKPFLGYDKDHDALKFPSGRFRGVFFSEEIKYAKRLGYKIMLLHGYGFKPKKGLFSPFIDFLYRCRIEAKLEGNMPIAWAYKTLMNALYGRLGIHPESTVTELCDAEKFNELLRSPSFQGADWIDVDRCLVQLKTDIFSEAESGRATPNMAVHISAAITAYARIEMYEYLARDDCLYSDTDSVVLSKPLPPELVSDSGLGMFKMEYHIKRGYFLAPKCYMLETVDGKEIIRHKGVAKSDVTSDWFRKAYDNPAIEQELSHKAFFRIDWGSLNIHSKEFHYKLTLPPYTKRKKVFDENGRWIDTKPIKILDLGSQQMNDLFNFYDSEAGSEDEDETEGKDQSVENQNEKTQQTERGRRAGRTD